ncbi:MULTISPECIES: hypothetical protein [unclassified Campylobacter]|uniref:hypothetical protein n=1 Tax=unclassified Campylobacter TaxID=2593542 RepID=UPI001EFAC1BF|nr:hypothetical protein [Campylobacter sp. RM12651]MBZ7976733.1 hypothetical protein [Campylobacter sp. RM12637]ULO02898.1 hypothetical protein AVBRAN_0428 [Campylobacter sp. RM12651]
MVSKGFCERATMVDSEIICDKDLDLEALGLYSFLVFLSNISEPINLYKIAKSRNIDFKKHYKTLKRLEEKGYIELRDLRNILAKESLNSNDKFENIVVKVHNMYSRKRPQLGE